MECHFISELGIEAALKARHRAARARIVGAGRPELPPERAWKTFGDCSARLEPAWPVEAVLPLEVVVSAPEFVVQGATAPEIARNFRKQVCEKHNVTVAQLESVRKFPPIVRARQELMWLLQHHMNWSVSHIGRFMGRDHTTIIHGIRRHAAILAAIAAVGKLKEASC